MPLFDPEGTGYDMETALRYGMGRDATGHMGSVVPINPLVGQLMGLPTNAYMLLKGRKHETWDMAVKGEKERGYKVIKGPDGRYYSVPMTGEEGP